MLRVVVGVTGGIAAYKVALLIREFTEAGHSVKVVATANALRFIGAPTLEALSHQKVEIVDPNLFTDVEQVKHVSIAKDCDLLVVAPATASFIAKMAAGISDDLLLTTVLATKAPIVLAPAMHTEMWENQATKDNLKTLISRGVHVVQPSVGRLTGEDTGIGRLAEIEEIYASAVQSVTAQDLLGKRVVITAGGTREPMDAVRFFGNASSGKQGIAFAKAATQRGATVTLIAANLDQEFQQKGIKVIQVVTALQMQAEVIKEISEADFLIMAAAVADYRPVDVATGKLKKSALGESISVKLVQNPDILRLAVDEIKTQGLGCVTVGFAAEVVASEEELLELGLRKLAEKGCDFIVANDVSEGQVFGSDENRVYVISNNSNIFVAGSKDQVANEVLSEALVRK